MIISFEEGISKFVSEPSKDHQIWKNDISENYISFNHIDNTLYRELLKLPPFSMASLVDLTANLLSSGGWEIEHLVTGKKYILSKNKNFRTITNQDNKDIKNIQTQKNHIPKKEKSPSCFVWWLFAVLLFIMCNIVGVQ